jgi:hypothetical protein
MTAVNIAPSRSYSRAGIKGSQQQYPPTAEPNGYHKGGMTLEYGEGALRGEDFRWVFEERNQVFASMNASILLGASIIFAFICAYFMVQINVHPSNS